MARKVADLVVEVLAEAGVQQIFGVVGDSLNGITDALRRHGGIEWFHVRHEEAAAFAAAGASQITGRLAVCAGSCGPGNLHLINGLFDANRSRTPVLAIAAQIPSAEIGGGYFQETHPQSLFAECSVYCELVSDPRQMPFVLENAIRAAVGQRGVAVIVIPGTSPSAPRPSAGRLPRRPVAPAADDHACASRTRRARRADERRRADHAVLRAGLRRGPCVPDAARRDPEEPIVHAYGGKEWVEYENPYDVGMTGFIGFRSGYDAMHACDLWCCSARFPLQAVPPFRLPDRPGRHPAPAARPALQARPRDRRRREGDHRGAAAASRDP